MVQVREGLFAGQEATDLDELARQGARRMPMAALDVEVTEYVTRHRGERDERGHARVVRGWTGPAAEGNGGIRNHGGTGTSSG